MSGPWNKMDLSLTVDGTGPGRKGPVIGWTCHLLLTGRTPKGLRKSLLHRYFVKPMESTMNRDNAIALLQQ